MVRTTTVLGVLLFSLVPALVESEGLDALAKAQGLRIGTALVIDWAADQTLAPLIRSEYGFLAPTSAADWDGTEDWQTWVANAQTLGLPFRGARFTGGKSPARLGSLSPKALEREVVIRMQTLQGQSKPSPVSWDVASNLFTASGAPSGSAFRSVWGPDWAAKALLLAKSVDPQTPLFLEEDDTLGLNPRSDALYQLAADWKARGLPLDGVALGGRQRLSARSSGLEIGSNLKRFADLGLKIHIIDWELGLDRDQTIPDRDVINSQADAYQEVLSWILATPAVTLVTTAEPSDRFVRPGPPGVAWASPSLYTVSGIPKAGTWALGPLLRGPRPTAVTLAAKADRSSQVPLDGFSESGLPRAWNTADVWHLVPATEATLPGGEFRHRATFYRNLTAASKNPTSDDFGMSWYLTWTKEGLVFQVERSDDIILPGKQGESLSFEIRGPGFSAKGTAVVGVDFNEPLYSGTWSQGGQGLRLVFRVPPGAGWGPGTLFFFRFSGTDNDGGNDLGLTLDPWPLTTQGGPLPWKAFRIVTPYE